MITRAQIRRQLRASGGIMNVAPREKFGLGSKIKDRFRKLIPNEIADIAVKAAPFVAPFNPGIAGLMRGIGRFDQRGSISDALKQGLATTAFGAGSRALGGAENIMGGGLRGGFTNPIGEGRMQSMKDLFQGEKKSTFIEDGETLEGLSPGTKANEGTSFVKTGTDFLSDKVPGFGKLDQIVKEKLLVGGVTSAATYIYESLIKSYPDPEPGQDMEQYLAERKERVGVQMRKYMDSYFANDPEYMALDDAGRNEFVSRYNVRDGGRIGYQTGGISMGNTLQQNIATNRGQATGIQAMLNQARKRAGLPAVQAAPMPIDGRLPPMDPNQPTTTVPLPSLPRKPSDNPFNMLDPNITNLNQLGPGKIDNQGQDPFRDPVTGGGQPIYGPGPGGISGPMALPDLNNMTRPATLPGMQPDPNLQDIKLQTSPGPMPLPDLNNRPPDRVTDMMQNDPRFIGGRPGSAIPMPELRTIEERKQMAEDMNNAPTGIMTNDGTRVPITFENIGDGSNTMPSMPRPGGPISGPMPLPDLGITGAMPRPPGPQLIGEKENLILSPGLPPQNLGPGTPGMNPIMDPRGPTPEMLDAMEDGTFEEKFMGPPERPVPPTSGVDPINEMPLPNPGRPIPPTSGVSPINQMPMLPTDPGIGLTLPGYEENDEGRVNAPIPMPNRPITNLPGAEPQPIDEMPMLPPDRPITESPFPGTGAYTPPGSENIMGGFESFLEDSGAMNRPMTADVVSYKLPDGTVQQGNSTMRGLMDQYLESIGQPPTTSANSFSGGQLQQVQPGAGTNTGGKFTDLQRPREPMMDPNFANLSPQEQDASMEKFRKETDAYIKRFGSFADGREIDPMQGRSAYRDILNAIQTDYPDIFKTLKGDETLAELDQKMLDEQQRSGAARGGRIGLMGGSMPMGIMRTNQAGVMERDYRNKGGFVPVGVKEKADDVPAMLSKNEFVMTADAVRGAGGGSIDKGAQKMYNTMKSLEGRVR